jgi:hypothetical protein
MAQSTEYRLQSTDYERHWGNGDKRVGAWFTAPSYT